MTIVVQRSSSSEPRTFLELCQALRQETGISGADGAPVSVVNQTGELKRVVDWIARAYRDIQRKHRNWDFLRSDFSFQTIAATQTYAPSSVSLDEHKTWKLDTFRAYLTATGVSDEQFLYFVPWEDFRDLYLFSTMRQITGRPMRFTVAPNSAVLLDPTPNAVFTVVGEYFMRPQVMTGNEDVPIFPEDFRDVLVWRAFAYYAPFEGAPEVYAHGLNEYKRLIWELEVDQLPAIEIAGPMA